MPRASGSKARQAESRRAGGLSPLAVALLRDMAAEPSRLEYNTRPLGGMFREEDLRRLDDAYAELVKGGFAEPTGATVSFFGAPKRIFRVSAKGLSHARGNAA